MLHAFFQVAPAVMGSIASVGGAVLIHCEYGKDRAGLVAALLLDLAEVRPELIAEDYALTAKCLRPIVEKFLNDGPGERSEREADVGRFAARPEVILDTLQALDAEHGGSDPLALAAAATSAVALATGTRRYRMAILGVIVGSITVVGMPAQYLAFLVFGGD